MRHLVIGQRQKAPNFSAFHWSPHGCLITIGQHFVTTRVVHLPKRTETSLITESDQSRANYLLLQLCTVRTAFGPGYAGRALLQKLVLFFSVEPPLLNGSPLKGEICSVPIAAITQGAYGVMETFYFCYLKPITVLEKDL